MVNYQLAFYYLLNRDADDFNEYAAAAIHCNEKLSDAEEILKINHPKLTGVDLNSGFEDAPGMKNIEKLKNFITKITM